MVNKTIIGCFILALAFSCKKPKTEDPVDFKYQYAPIVIGHYCLYDVVEINHDDAVGIHDTITYKLKEKIAESFVDAEGRPSLRVERFVLSGSGEWSITDVWYSTRTTTRYEKVEEDVRFVRLAFPVKEKTRWNGNATNTLGEMEYEYTDADVSRSFNGLNFANTARVLQMDEFNFVQRKLMYEIYAKDVGLAYKHYKDLNINFADSTNALTGKELYMTLYSYGVE